MKNWPATKARRVLAALERIGWRIKRQSGSHRLLTREGWPDYEFSFHENEEIGRRMLQELPSMPDSNRLIYSITPDRSAQLHRARIRSDSKTSP